MIKAYKGRKNETCPIFSNSLSTEVGLIFAQSDTSRITSKIFGGIGNKSAPTTSNI